MSFFCESVFCLLAAALLAVFYYCFNDGIPRLFSLLAILFSFIFFQKTFGRLAARLFNSLYVGLYLLSLYALAYLLKPPFLFLLSLLRLVKGRLFAVQKKLFFLLFAVFSPLVMKRYMRKELSRLDKLGLLEEVSD